MKMKKIFYYFFIIYTVLCILQFVRIDQFVNQNVIKNSFLVAGICNYLS